MVQRIFPAAFSIIDRITKEAFKKGFSFRVGISCFHQKSSSKALPLQKATKLSAIEKWPHLTTRMGMAFAALKRANADYYVIGMSCRHSFVHFCSPSPVIKLLGKV